MNIFKTVSKTILIGIFLSISVKNISAFNYQSIETSGFETQISDQSNIQYANPTQFYITQVTTPAKDLENNPEQWVSSLYYYSITRLKFADIPYNFLLDENGQIYEGRKGGIGVNPELKEINGTVTIGYLSNNPILTTRAERSLLKMIEDISYQWGMNKYSTVKLNISESENTLTTVVPEEINNDFSESVQEALEDWKGYDQEHLEYKTNIEEVINEETVEIGSKLKVKIKIQNKNEFPWFTDKDPIYISVKEKEESEFAVNGIWDSFSKATHISDKVVKPDEFVEVEFDLQSKIKPGSAKESFELLKFTGQPFENSSFDINFEIVKGENKLVEIYSPQYGFVNIRECPRYNCKVLDSVDEGSVYIEKERNESGWVKIKYDDNTDGWIYVKYIKSI